MSDAARLLDAWERALNQPPAQRALTLLAVACPDLSPEACAELSVGTRDARLLDLRERLFGPSMVSIAACPACGERVELNLQTSELRVQPEREVKEPIALTVGEYSARFRLPNSRDLAALMTEPIANASARNLLMRCLVSVERQGVLVSSDSLPPKVVDAIADDMARADPQADVRLALVCPVCSQAWQATFDIAAYLWSEVQAWAARMLREVHALASAYGWSEADILAMTATRRRLYLEMLQE